MVGRRPHRLGQPVSGSRQEGDLPCRPASPGSDGCPPRSRLLLAGLGGRPARGQAEAEGALGRLPPGRPAGSCRRWSRSGRRATPARSTPPRLRRARSPAARPEPGLPREPRRLGRGRRRAAGLVLTNDHVVQGAAPGRRDPARRPRAAGHRRSAATPRATSPCSSIDPGGWPRPTGATPRPWTSATGSSPSASRSGSPARSPPGSSAARGGASACRCTRT